ncbi:MAG: FKBP-type peptidyl-prolyl cis-trans isomerase [Bacteroidales bacterium]|nr:FKBP-type peptidyl-prolyl cis-trans isomerase [Bacteroidales bacterium]
MKSRHIIILSVMSCLLASCTKEQIKEKYNTQEERIEQFIQNQIAQDKSRSVVYNKGSQRLILKEGEGEALNEKGTISFYYAGYVFSGNSISNDAMFATNNKDIAESVKWNVSDTTAFEIKTLTLSEGDMVTGLKNGLVGVKGGEECYILFSGKYGFGNKQSGTIPANSALVYHVWVESLSNE